MSGIGIPSVGTAGTQAADASRISNRENLEKAAQQFESIFVGMMLKSMRSAQDSMSSGLFDNDATKQFRDMQDSQLAKHLGGKGTLGIAKAMVAYLDRTQPGGPKAAEEPKP